MLSVAHRNEALLSLVIIHRPFKSSALAISGASWPFLVMIQVGRVRMVDLSKGKLDRDPSNFMVSC